jgi:hypothetical protein
MARNRQGYLARPLKSWRDTQRVRSIRLLALAPIVVVCAIAGVTTASSDLRDPFSQIPRESGPVGPVYPAPTSLAEGDSRPGCPSTSGVVSGIRPSVSNVVALLETLGHAKSKLAVERVTDPSDWTETSYLLTAFKPAPPANKLATRILIWPDTKKRLISGLEPVVATTICSLRIWRATSIAQICPGPYDEPAAQTCTRDPALAGNVFVIDRLGHWLVTWTYP